MTHARKSNLEKNLQKRITELEENWKRALADYRNLEKRIDEKQKIFVRLANASLIDKLLGILDGLERAVEHIKDEGIRIIHKQLWEVLQSEDVKEIEVKGKYFDPETMDCGEMVPGQKNMVAEVVLKGYTLNDHVIRPAKVKVGDGTKRPKSDAKKS